MMGKVFGTFFILGLFLTQVACPHQFEITSIPFLSDHIHSPLPLEKGHLVIDCDDSLYHHPQTFLTASFSFNALRDWSLWNFENRELFQNIYPFLLFRPPIS
jgi:hypothetical protein